MAKARKPGTGSVGPLNVSSLQGEITKANAAWQAGETPLTAMSEAERTAHLGLVVDPAELAASKQVIAAANKLMQLQAGTKGLQAVTAPAAIDWRNNGGNFVTSIKDQASCGSCVSFATIATIESRVNIACRTPGTARDYSEAFLFYCGCGNCCGTGWNFVPALDFCKNTGVALDSDFPYTPGNQSCKAGVTAAFKINGHTAAYSQADRQTAIAERGPVVAGMAVYSDFYAYRGGVYRHVSGVLEGYHAVSVVGYNNAQSCWICKNSWNTGWGESGFFRIGYGEVEIDTTFAFHEPQLVCPAPRPTPVDECSQYLSHLRRVLEVASRHSGLRACLRYHICHRGFRPACSAEILQIVRTVAAILQRCPQYRTAFCRALG